MKKISEEEHSKGYFKSPNFLFDLPISQGAKIILLYFCRRADKSGVSFPCIKRISEDTGIKSATTVRNYTNELIESELITKIPGGRKGGSNIYQLCPFIVSICGSRRRSENEEGSYFDYPDSEETSEPASISDYPQPDFDSVGGHEMTTKEYSVKENFNKEEFENQDFYNNSFSSKGKHKERPESRPEMKNEHSKIMRHGTLKKSSVPEFPEEQRMSDEKHELLKEARDRLIRRAQGEDVNLSDIRARLKKENNFP